MKEISLSQGEAVLVDDEDFEWLMQWKWYAFKCCNTFYAVRNKSIKYDGKRGLVYMHIAILGKKDGFEVDHKDGNGLNCQRYNLRHATKRQNQQNQHIKRTSQYPGVHWHKPLAKWMGAIKISGKKKNLGCYVTELEAFTAYRQAVESLGEDVI